MASQNDPFYVGGSVELLQSSGETPTVYFVGGSVYIVHEYAAGGTTTTTLAPTTTPPTTTEPPIVWTTIYLQGINDYNGQPIEGVFKYREM